MARVLVHLIPRPVFFFPNDHFSVIGARGQNVAIGGMCPGHLPHRTFVSACEKEKKSFTESRHTHVILAICSELTLTLSANPRDAKANFFGNCNCWCLQAHANINI